MTGMATAKKTFTVREAADQLGVGTSRVRQLCAKYGIGRLVDSPIGPYRQLSTRDVEFLRHRKTSPGPEKNLENVA